MNELDEVAGVSADDAAFRHFPHFQPQHYEGHEGYTVPQVSDVVGTHRPVRRGEVHLHHALTWHGSADNTSERERRAHAIHYMAANSVYVECAAFLTALAPELSPTESAFGRSGEHVMKTFVVCADGRPMSEAGPHFPRVSAEFDVLPPPPRPEAGEVGPLTRVGGRAGTGER